MLTQFLYQDLRFSYLWLSVYQGAIRNLYEVSIASVVHLGYDQLISQIILGNNDQEQASVKR